MDYRVFLAAPLAALMLSVSAAELRRPHDWDARAMTHSYSTGSGYEIGVDPQDEAMGYRSLTIRSVGKLLAERPSVGVAQQLAYGYGGKRVRFAGQLRAQGVLTWAGLYLGAGDEQLLIGLPAGGAGPLPPVPMGAAATDSNWRDVSVVVDVPAGALALNLGLALVGEGQVWARELRFEVVGRHVPLSGAPVGIDWAQAREAQLLAEKYMSTTIQPQPLANATLD